MAKIKYRDVQRSKGNWVRVVNTKYYYRKCLIYELTTAGIALPIGIASLYWLRHVDARPFPYVPYGLLCVIGIGIGIIGSLSAIGSLYGIRTAPAVEPRTEYHEPDEDMIRRKYEREQLASDIVDEMDRRNY